MLRVEGISKIIAGKKILSDVQLHQADGEKLTIAGETGSGKSTLLKIIAGFVQPDSGRVFFEDKKVLGPDEQLIAGHPHIGYLSQHFELRNNYYVHEILEYADHLNVGEASQIFHICQIEHLLHRKTNDGLSGGEKQRIATARLLISRPKLLLLDEPFSNLDLGHKQIMKSIIQKMSDELKITLMMVSHDPDDILPWSDRILIMKDGVIIENASPDEIYHHPKDPYIAGLTGKYNLMPDGSILRPEQFELVEHDSGAMEVNEKQTMQDSKQTANQDSKQTANHDSKQSNMIGTVLRCTFYGDHYELWISDQSHTYLIHSPTAVPVGNKVSFRKK